MGFKEFYLTETIDDIYEYLCEYSYKDMRTINIVSKVRQKSPNLPSGTRYVGFDKNTNTMTFSTESQTHPGTGLRWIQKIKLLNIPEALKNTKLTLIERIRTAINGEIQIECNCPSFNFYGYRYILTNSITNNPKSLTKSNLGIDEHRYPRIKNPQLIGCSCKHLDSALYILPYYNNDLVRYFK